MSSINGTPGTLDLAELQAQYNLPRICLASSSDFPNKQKVVTSVVDQLARAHLADKRNLTTLFTLCDGQCSDICAVLQSIESVKGQSEQEELLNQQSLTRLFSFPKTQWGFYLPFLQRRGILNRDNLDALIRDPANGKSIIGGLLCLESIRNRNAHQAYRAANDNELERYRTAVIAAGAGAESLGDGLKSLHQIPNLEDDIFEAYREALLQCPENAEHIAHGLVILNTMGILRLYWRQVLAAKEYVGVLVDAIKLLRPRGELLSENHPIFCVDAWFAEEVALGVLEIKSKPNLCQETDVYERCITMLISGDPLGEHAKTITEQLERLGPEATLEGFIAIVEALPVPEAPIMK